MAKSTLLRCSNSAEDDCKSSSRSLCDISYVKLIHYLTHTLQATALVLNTNYARKWLKLYTVSELFLTCPCTSITQFPCTVFQVDYKLRRHTSAQLKLKYEVNYRLILSLQLKYNFEDHLRRIYCLSTERKPTIL